MSRTSTQYRQLSQIDYVKLMQLLPRLKLDLERHGDDAGAVHTLETIKIVGQRAKAFIDESLTDTDDGAAKWAKDIVAGQTK